IPTVRKWADHVHPTPEEKLAAAGGTFAYCGRYEIVVKQKQIVHLPEVATDPGYVGSRQIRPYTFQHGRLILSDVEKTIPPLHVGRLYGRKPNSRREEIRCLANTRNYHCPKFRSL